MITVFLRSLIHHWKGQFVAVILSRLDGDGAAAICQLKSAGGVTIVQKADTAKNEDMLRTAIATGSVDFVLDVENIAREIVRLAREAACGQPHSQVST